MSAATLLTRLYPPAVRERWGADIRHEVAAAGLRSWPDTLAGAARLWLHPADWPETSTGQTRRVLTVTVFALAAVAGLLLRHAEPSSALTADARHPVTSLWLVPVLAGVLLAAPLPPLDAAELRRSAATAVRVMATPAAAVAVLCALAWSGAAGHHRTGGAGGALVLSYWLTLGFVAFRLCVLVSRLLRTSRPATTGRLSGALLLMGAGLVLAAGQNLLLAPTPARPGALAETAALGLVAAAALGTGRGLRHHG
jgi:hypothetical protein